MRSTQFEGQQVAPEGEGQIGIDVTHNGRSAIITEGESRATLDTSLKALFENQSRILT